MIQNALPLSRNRRKELLSLPWTSAPHLMMSLPPLSIMQQKVSLLLWSEITDHLAAWIPDASVGQNTVHCPMRKIRQILLRLSAVDFLFCHSPVGSWECVVTKILDFLQVCLSSVVALQWVALAAFSQVDVVVSLECPLLSAVNDPGALSQGLALCCGDLA